MTENNKTNKKPILTNALIWATVMIASSLILADISGDVKANLLMLYIVGWFTTDQAIRGKARTLKQEWMCIKGFVGKFSS